MLDRIDIHVEVPAVQFSELSSAKLGACSEEIRADAIHVRTAQAERFAGTSIMYNAQMSSRQIREYYPLLRIASNCLSTQWTKWDYPQELTTKCCVCRERSQTSKAQLK